MDDIALAILRTTGCTTLAALIAQIVLKRQRTKIPVVHRIVWCLVLVQGWALLPITLPVLLARSDTVTNSGHDTAAERLSSSAGVPSHEILEKPTTVASEIRSDRGWKWIVLVWLVGVIAVILRGVKQYTSLIVNMPLGRPLTDPRWQEEWTRISNDVGVVNRTQFRLTNGIGPLCCYVPFFYLIVAPERLWCSFQPSQREYVLRHELAHVMRGDLWKSVLVRFLALPQWFNPFAWKAVWAFDEAAEWACDDFVVRTCNSARSEYAATLLEIAESYFYPLRGTVGARGGVLSERVSRLVYPTIMEESKMTRLLVPAMLVLLLVAQSVRIVAAEVDSQQSPSQRSITSGAQVEPESIVSDQARRADLKRTGLVPYRVAPPDILKIQAVRLSPKSPYRIGSLDRLQIVVPGLPIEKQIAAILQVDSNGFVDLGPSYEAVKLEGLTTNEAEKAIAKHVGQWVPNAQTSVALLQSPGVQQVAGEHLIGPDGFVNLGDYGQAYVAGMTTDEARAAIEKQLSKHFNEPRIAVDVLVYNSKFYYIIVEGDEPGDNVLRVPMTGNETLLDAIAQLGDLEPLKNKHVWISRPSHEGSSDEILPVDWKAITRGAKSGINHPLLPGDRVFVSDRRADESKTREHVLQVARAPIAVPSTTNISVGGTELFTFEGPDGDVLVRLPERVVPPARTNPVRVRVEVLSDANKNLSEYWASQAGNALLVDTEQLSASLRIMRKNDIITTKMAPTITCKPGQEATIEVDGFRITAKPTIEDSGVLLMTQISPGAYSQSIDANAVLRKGESLLVRATPNDSVFVVLTAELLR